MSNNRPIGIDLFAGAGGLSLGFEQAGFDIACSVEVDPVHCAIHSVNFPKTKEFCASVVDVKGRALMKAAGLRKGELDVLFGGAPCQGFSMIGKRALDDERNALPKHFIRLVSEMKPKYFVFENVKGLTVGQHRQFLEEIIEAFEAEGYKLVSPYRVLVATHYGVPQRRERLFLLGARKGMPLPRYPLQQSREAGKSDDIFLPATPTVADAISDLPDADSFDELLKGDAVRSRFGKPSKYAKLMRGGEDPTDFSYPRKYAKGWLTSSLRTVHSEKSKARFAGTEGGDTEPISRFFKLPSDGYCNTLRAGTASDRGAFTSPRPIHPTSPRCITNREAARLHSFPDWFRVHITKWHGFRQIGNSVPPLLGRAVAEEIVNALGITPEKPDEILELGDKRLLSANMKEAAKHFDVPHDVIPQRNRKQPETANC